jgi:hypothetical protein
VSVADENVVRLNRFGGERSGGVSVEEGVNHKFVPARFESEGGMSVPGQGCSLFL